MCSYERGRGSRVAVRVPPHRPVDVYVLDKQGHQQIQEEQELKEQAAVQRQLGDPRVTHRLRNNEGRDRGRRLTHHVTAPEGTQPHLKYTYRQKVWCRTMFVSHHTQFSNLDSGLKFISILMPVLQGLHLIFFQRNPFATILMDNSSLCK